ncbi:MAG: signal recognition particle-docking protein FtsY [Nanoarchaeota archaeon]
MFNKIKGKLKNVFSKSQKEIFDEDEIKDDGTQDVEDNIEKKIEDNEKENIDVDNKSDLEKDDIEDDDIKNSKINKNNEEKKEKNDKTQKEDIDVKDKNNLEEDGIEDDKNDIEEIEKPKKQGFFSSTFSKVTSKTLSEDDFDKIWLELEIFLLEINIAYEIVEEIEKTLRDSILGEKFDRFSLSKKIREVLIEKVSEVLKSKESNFLEKIKEVKKTDNVVKIIVIGVNGTGKTTTIAKMVQYLRDNDLSCVVAASDTFRAAAIEQLEEHSKALNFKLIKHKGGSDPAAVAYDTIEHAKAKGLDVAIIDTAGRMPNNSNLMQELSKIERVTKSHLNIFIGDSVSGNDLIEQIELFGKILKIDGLILTKTDTDERPGSVVTAAYSIDKPIYFLGIGQKYDDLVVFDSKQVAQKLFELEEE